MTAIPATSAPASVPVSKAQTNGIDLRKARRIVCAGRSDSCKIVILRKNPDFWTTLNDSAALQFSCDKEWQERVA